METPNNYFNWTDLKEFSLSYFNSSKENNLKKNKMIPILLGVTKESVVRMDAETKEIIKTWSLTQLRRWAASPNR